jgi:hypothetical protein
LPKGFWWYIITSNGVKWKKVGESGKNCGKVKDKILRD